MFYYLENKKEKFQTITLLFKTLGYLWLSKNEFMKQGLWSEENMTLFNRQEAYEPWLDEDLLSAENNGKMWDSPKWRFEMMGDLAYLAQIVRIVKLMNLWNKGFEVRQTWHFLIDKNPINLDLMNTFWVQKKMVKCETHQSEGLRWWDTWNILYKYWE